MMKLLRALTQLVLSVSLATQVFGQSSVELRVSPGGVLQSPANFFVTNGVVMATTSSTFIYCETNGNDASAKPGRADLPFATLAAALGAVSGPTVIQMGCGTFAASNLLVSANTTIRGQGSLTTVLTATNGGVYPSGFATAGDNITLEDFTLGERLQDQSFYFPLMPCWGTNLLVRNLSILGDSDCIYNQSMGAVSGLFANCFIHSSYDTLNVEVQSGSAAFSFVNDLFLVDGEKFGSFETGMHLNVGGGQAVAVAVQGCTFCVTNNNTQGTYGIHLQAGTSATLSDNQFFVSSPPGAAYGVYVESGASAIIKGPIAASDITNAGGTVVYDPINPNTLPGILPQLSMNNGALLTNLSLSSFSSLVQTNVIATNNFNTFLGNANCLVITNGSVVQMVYSNNTSSQQMDAYFSSSAYQSIYTNYNIRQSLWVLSQFTNSTLRISANNLSVVATINLTTNWTFYTFTDPINAYPGVLYYGTNGVYSAVPTNIPSGTVMFQISNYTALVYTNYSPFGAASSNAYSGPTTPMLLSNLNFYTISGGNVTNLLYYQHLVSQWKPYDYAYQLGGACFNHATAALVVNPTNSTTNLLTTYDLSTLSNVQSASITMITGYTNVDHGPLNIMAIGDSYTYNGSWESGVKALCPDLIFNGGMRVPYGDATLLNEGRGGWTLSNYLSPLTNGTNDSFSPFMQPTNSLVFYGNTAFWKYVVGSNPSSSQSYGCNGFYSEGTNIGFSATTGYKSSPTTNALMWSDADNQYEQWNGSAWVASSVTTNNYSSNFRFNFGKYRSTWNISQPNIVLVLLGLNDFRSQTTTNAVYSVYTNSWGTNLEAAIVSIHADSPSAQVVILLPPSCCGPMDNTSGAFTLMQHYMMWYARSLMVAQFKNRSDVSVIESGACIDPDYGFTYNSELPFPAYSGTQTRSVANNVPHPSTGGYYQMAYPIAGFIQATR